MPLLYLLLLIIMMFLGGMLIKLNPEPLQFTIGFGRHYTVQSSILELIGVSVLTGAIAMMLPYARSLIDAYRERRRLQREAEELRQANVSLRRESELAHTASKLLEARVAEVEERYAQLEAEARPLLTMRHDPEAPPADGQPRPARRTQRPVPSRWRRR